MHRRVLPLTATALTATAALLLAACGDRKDIVDPNHPARATAGSVKAHGVVSLAEANRIVDHYEDVNNRANKRQDAKLLATVEDGNLLERSTAGYEQLRTLSTKDQRDYVKSFAFKERKFYIPARGDWFMFIGTSTETADARPSVHVFDKSSGNWRMTVSVDVRTTMPRIATDTNGLVTPATVTAHTGAHAPEDIPDAYEDLWATGGRREGRILANNALVKEAKEAFHVRNEDWSDARRGNRYFPRTNPKHNDAYALKTANGGTLAVVPIAHQQITRVNNPSLKITPDAKEKIYDPRPRTLIIDDFHGQALTHLHPAGKPRIISVQYEMVDSH